ncbi:MAG: hypothetical protein IJP38_03275 [Oscillospiraceae bacterium]|nr:hypothetical protein [Oscillospiraceae bacterium]
MAEGHRDRVRNRFTEENIDTIPEYIVLEKILHGVIPRVDTSAAARTLISEFGSLARVIDAPPHELQRIPGVGPAAVSFLKSLPLFYRKYVQSKWGAHHVFTNYEDIAQYMEERLIGYENEAVVVMCLDSHFKLLCCKAIFEGSINSVEISVRKVVDYAISSKASRIVLAHNHLCDDSYPSRDDINTTKMIYNSLSPMNIAIDDHYICAPNSRSSMRALNLMPDQLAKKKQEAEDQASDDSES